MTAAFDLCPGNGGIGVLVLADHIPQADLYRIKTELLRAKIQQTLHDQDGNRQAHAAVSAQCDFIGDYGHRFVAIGGNLIRTGQGGCCVPGFKRRAERKGRIRANVVQKAGFESEDRSVVFQGDLGLNNLMLGVHCRGQIFTSILNPLDRTAKTTGEEGNQDFLGKHMRLGSKAAAHVRGDGADMVFGKV